MKARFLLIITAWFITYEAQCQVTDNYVTNGRVNSIYASGGILYIGGKFTQVGPNIPYGAGISVTTGVANTLFARPNGSIYAAIPNGNGGWYIGGNFTKIGNISRNYIAEIDSNGTVTAWNPGSDDNIYTLALQGTTLYAGGNFSNIGGQSRAYIASLSTATGNATAWDPGADYTVVTLAPSGSTIYAGGYFTSIGGQNRNFVAALDAATGNATNWNPNANNGVLSLSLSGSNVFAGGMFTNIGGQSRNYIAQLDTTTAIATTWNAGADGAVRSLAGTGNRLYAGGDFFNIGGLSRAHIAALNISTAAATAWNGNADGTVNAISLSGNIVYAGGVFSNIGGQNRNNLAELDSTAGLATSWNPNVNNPVNAVAVAGSTVYAAGDFSSVGGQVRNNIAALDINTGVVTNWNPNANEIINTISASGNTVYAGGVFTSIGGQSRNKIAAIDAVTGLATAWNPNANNPVYTIVPHGATIYAGGGFSNIGGQARLLIAALDSATGNATTWNPGTSGIVRTIAVEGNVVYAGGNFSSVAGQVRHYAAAIDATTGVPTSWNPNANAVITAIAKSGNTIYLGGHFYLLNNSVSRNAIAAVDAVTGTATSWNPTALTAGSTGEVSTIIPLGNTILTGGTFTSIGGQNRNYLAALDSVTGLATSWNPDANSSVLSMARRDSATLFIGGLFTTVSNDAHGYLAGVALPVPASTLCDSTTLPYTQNFEAAIVPAIPGCIPAENNGNGNNWITENNPASGFTSKTLVYNRNITNPANVWFYTRGISMVAGTSYRLTFRYGNDNNVHTESLDVSYGNAPSASSMTNLVVNYPTINSGIAAQSITDFIPTASGVYYFGFYAYSTANQGKLLVDDIDVSLTPSQPVNLLSFRGEKHDTQNLLNWATATEQNNTGFELQRSANGSNFSTVSFIPTKANGGNSSEILSYNYIDAKPLGGDNYYRLNQIDKDGKSTFSNIVLVKGKEVEQIVLSALYPNPARQTLNVIITSPIAQQAQLLITDMAGKLAQQQSVQVQAGDNYKPINLVNLQEGSYIIKVICTNGNQSSLGKFLKQ